MRIIVRAVLGLCAASLLVWANQAPRAHNTVLFAQPGEPLEVLLSAEDPEGGILTFELLEKPAHGQVLGSPPQLVYLPNPGFEGSTRFSFRVTDPFGSFDIGVVEIRVSRVFQSLRVLPRVPEGFSWQGIAEFLARRGVRTWYVVDVEPRPFPPSLICFVFAGAGREAQGFLVGPLEGPASPEFIGSTGYVTVDLQKALPGTYLFLWVSGTEAFSYPFRIVLPVPDRKLAFGG